MARQASASAATRAWRPWDRGRRRREGRRGAEEPRGADAAGEAGSGYRDAPPSAGGGAGRFRHGEALRGRREGSGGRSGPGVREALSRGMDAPAGIISRLSALGSRLSALGSRLSALGSRLSALGSRLSALGSRLSALGSRLSALGSRLSALGSRLSALGSRLLITVRPSGLASALSISVCVGSGVRRSPTALDVPASRTAGHGDPLALAVAASSLAPGPSPRGCAP